MGESVNKKVILVTGGATGLGFAMVDSFLEKGAGKLIIIDVKEQDGLDAIKSVESKYGKGKAVFYKCDVAADLEDTFKKIIDEYKYVDVVINNAGILNEKSIRKTMEINAIAVMEWTSKFYDHMRIDRGGQGGTIINVSSIYGFRVIPFIPYYHASKFAVIGFSKSMGHEYNFKKSGVRVVVLCPGLTYTNMGNNPQARDEESLPDFITEVKETEWQSADAIGKGTVEIFEKAESGTVWLVEGSRPAQKI